LAGDQRPDFRPYVRDRLCANVYGRG